MTTTSMLYDMQLSCFRSTKPVFDYRGHVMIRVSDLHKIRHDTLPIYNSSSIASATFSSLPALIIFLPCLCSSPSMSPSSPLPAPSSSFQSLLDPSSPVPSKSVHVPFQCQSPPLPVSVPFHPATAMSSFSCRCTFLLLPYQCPFLFLSLAVQAPVSPVPLSIILIQTLRHPSCSLPVVLPPPAGRNTRFSRVSSNTKPASKQRK